MIPVEECEFKCAVGATCGSETECAIGSAVIYIVLGIFGCFIVIFFTIFCCVLCKASSDAKKLHEPLIEKRRHSGESSSDESDKEKKKAKKAKEYNPEAQFM